MATIKWHYSLFIPIISLSIFSFQSSVLRSRTILSICLFLLFSFYINSNITYPKLTEDRIYGAGHINIKSINIYKSPFSTNMVYKGTIKSFFSKGRLIAKNIPFSTFVPLKKSRPIANCSYIVQGVLIKKDDTKYSLKIHKNATWHPIKNTFSFAEKRFHAKQFVGKYIQKHIKNTKKCRFFNWYFHWRLCKQYDVIANFPVLVYLI